MLRSRPLLPQPLATPLSFTTQTWSGDMWSSFVDDLTVRDGGHPLAPLASVILPHLVFSAFLRSGGRSPGTGDGYEASLRTRPRGLIENGVETCGPVLSDGDENGHMLACLHARRAFQSPATLRAGRAVALRCAGRGRQQWIVAVGGRVGPETIDDRTFVRLMPSPLIDDAPRARSKHRRRHGRLFPAHDLP